MIFVNLIYKHFDILMSQYGQVTNSCTSWLCQMLALTRVSISRNSRGEMIHIFLSRAGELCFHFSFSSWFSRFLDKKSLALLDLWDFQNNSLSLLDFQDCEEKVLFLLSIYEILFTVSLSLPVRNATYLREKYVFFKVWDVVAKCYGMRFWGGFGVRKGPLLIKI